MPNVENNLVDVDGIRIASATIGDGPPIVLLHGFASSAKRNWQEPQWYATLTAAKRRVIGLDFRGHGGSDKPHDPHAYRIEMMMSDVIAVLDAMDIARTDLMGYSMGGRIGAALLANYPSRFERGVLAGVGGDLLGPRRDSEMIAQALEASDANTIADPVGRMFHDFAVRGRNDLQALAACMRGLHEAVDAESLRRIRAPVLVVAGARDTMVSDPQALTDLIPGARLLTVAERNHFTAVGARAFKDGALRFLESTPPTA